MIIKNKQLVQSVISTNNINMNVADVLTNAFMCIDAINPDEVKQYIKEGLDENEAIYNCLFDFIGVSKDDEESQKVLSEYFLNNLKKLNPSDYINNSYVKAIKKTGRKGKYALKFIDYAPYQLFAYDDIKINGYKEYSQIGYFDHKFSYLALTEGSNIWMSLNPNPSSRLVAFTSAVSLTRLKGFFRSFSVMA